MNATVITKKQNFHNIKKRTLAIKYLQHKFSISFPSNSLKKTRIFIIGKKCFECLKFKFLQSNNNEFIILKRFSIFVIIQKSKLMRNFVFKFQVFLLGQKNFINTSKKNSHKNRKFQWSINSSKKDKSLSLRYFILGGKLSVVFLILIFLVIQNFFTDTSKNNSHKNRKFQWSINNSKKFLSYNHIKNRFDRKLVLRENSHRFMSNLVLKFQVLLVTQHFFIDISKKKKSDKLKISVVYNTSSKNS
ncbi:hypothetical protein AGLY_003433 [Aphis glycines]|uniref:Transmembrane protein n=1 Tax=Aphis glycines TaxID=307491 RepID=A0A6G0U243_APHGL|nr:hypothetical protein AGLY_003433 [Aphis glycines]